MKRFVDLRSDSSSLPTEAMREAMRNATVGNDAFGEDPSVNSLESLAAEMLGKEAAMFVASGTMANLVAIMAYAQPGEAIITGTASHIILYEMASVSAVAGVVPLCIDDSSGVMAPEAIEDALKRKSHLRFKAIALENPHNVAGGTVLTPKDMATYSAVANRYDIPLYVDGSRIFNAAVAQGVSAAELVNEADAVMFCLSKGPCAPVGSVLVGRPDFIKRARTKRAMLGGQWRQAGILAAAGTVALRMMTERLAIDHRNAKLVAKWLSEIADIHCDPSRVQTNIVLFDISPLGVKADDFNKELEEFGVFVSVFGESVIRFITYKDVTLDDLKYSVEIVRKVTERHRP